ncbi:ATP-binding protein [Dokdonella fugitiva]|uniref:ATP-binding protein n=1 Tax=Dokdonella fugitiva TaxID=328517 RepID=UPI00181D5962|nr:ATP-binding protein [Dokdonella fugitiva]MBA8882569.1 two-component system sensor histidine kinase PilS (NtrC family) [Dokdonella fugitiva]
MSTGAQLLDTTASPGDITRRELYFFNLYRCLEAVVYVGLVFSPFAVDWVRVSRPLLGQAASAVYLVVALALLVSTERLRSRLAGTISTSLLIDIVAASLVLIALTGHSLVPMMLLVNVGIAALLLPHRAYVFATAAALGVAMPYAYQLLSEPGRENNSVETIAVVVAYFIVAALLRYLGGHMRAAEDLAARRGVDLLNLEQINDLIIQRMKTGVLLVDRANHILRINESAWHLIGNPPPNQRELGSAAPELSRRLYHWRHTGKSDQTAVALAHDVPEVIPRFTRLAPNDDTNVLIFLDDTSLLSRRAEELTLSSLGRLSASIAHEIRNPLAAIRYSAQLLAESPELNAEDKRLVDIINNHCTRANDVVENILQLSRRERSRPETIDLNAWVLAFVEDYKQSNDLGQDQLRAVTHNRTLEAMVDPQHLQQVVWNLVQNALRYGRQPNQPARVSVVARLAVDKGPPLLEVIDRGPGIPPKVAAQIFEPFYTTHEYGTGLGLYLAKQMSEASQASLEYVPVAGGGACFRITLTPAGALLASRIAPQSA